MKTCIRCGHVVSDSPTPCASCGADQRFAKRTNEKQDDTFLKVLCILTIVGASMTLFSAALTMGILADQGIEYLIFQIVGLLAVTGKMTGAILMLQKRLTGLYVYTGGAVVNILLTVVMAFGFSAIPADPAIPEGVMLLSIIIGIAIAVAFLVMYWLNINRKMLS